MNKILILTLVSLFSFICFATDVPINLSSISQNDFETEEQYRAAMKKVAVHAGSAAKRVQAGEATLTVPLGWYAWVLKAPRGGKNLYVTRSLDASTTSALTVFLDSQEIDKPTPSVEQLKASISTKPNSAVSSETVQGRIWVIRQWESKDKTAMYFAMKTPAKKGVHVVVGECPKDKESEACRKEILGTFRSLNLKGVL